MYAISLLTFWRFTNLIIVIIIIIIILLYGVEACLLLARQIKSIEFTLTRIFMKLFRTGSRITVNECQVNFGFLPDFDSHC